MNTNFIDNSRDATPAFSGVGMPGSIVTLFDNGMMIGEALVGEDGLWSLSASALPGGIHNLSVHGMDSFGNNNFMLGSAIMEVGEIAQPVPQPEQQPQPELQPEPSRTLVTPVISGAYDHIGADVGNVKSGEITDDARPVISGTGTVGDIVVVYNTDSNGQHEIGQAVVDAEGNWSVTPYGFATLAVGENQLTVVAIDPAVGTRSEVSEPYTLVVESFIPAPVHGEVMQGTAGDDVFANVGEADQVLAGAGNDLINLKSLNFALVDGGEGIDTVALSTQYANLYLNGVKDTLTSVEIFDLGNGHNTITVSMNDVLRMGSEELSVHGDKKALVINGEDGSTLAIENVHEQWIQSGGQDSQWTMSQHDYQYAGNTYNVWTIGNSSVELLVENTVNTIIM
ncbi:hypothetical protein EKN56_00115 [Limnobaculum zhutongyuii]|uniref:Bacterial Ig-like domain-containing protein n=1 Tax=Limnobaculum zhutongyuii TaxID=2498113 RepID=A0A411WFF9_9GAMM|nr:Ig-like domain-containing protein [Limnobaculum zhutongyuii]QBH94955.1 hypothetical protein EKN56_00115 [Limnobaculum zhutongyuii]TQS86320.1 hypothetical protein ELQ32_19510 [Limnobaculum zhutongyuii]